jgi:hypothetical protein
MPKDRNGKNNSSSSSIQMTWYCHGLSEILTDGLRNTKRSPIFTQEHLDVWNTSYLNEIAETKTPIQLSHSYSFHFWSIMWSCWIWRTRKIKAFSVTLGDVNIMPVGWYYTHTLPHKASF